MDTGRKKFIIFHSLFLLTLILIYYIPAICSIPQGSLMPPQDRLIRFFIIGVLSFSFLFYYLYLYFLKKINVPVFNGTLLTKYFWISTAVIFLFLCSSRELLSTDLYEFSIRGRMLSLYGLNPYIHIPEEIKQDMFYPLIFWNRTPECYGPAWVLIGTIHTVLFKNSIFWTSFMYKFILFGFFGGAAYIFHKICLELKFENAKILTLAFLTNPLIIVMTIVDGHNEIAMVFFILFSLWCLLRLQYIYSLIFFAIAIQVKFVYLMLAPLILLYILLGPGEKSLKTRIKALAVGSILSMGVIAMFWAPFGWQSVKAIVDYYRELGVLFWPDSIPYVVYFIFDKINMTIPTNVIANISSAIFAMIYVGLIVYFIKKVKRDRKAIFASSCLMFLALLLTNYSPFQSWYLLWVLPLIFLTEFKTKFMLVLFLSYFLMMSFWKRMCVLAIPMMIFYAIMFLQYRKNKNRWSFFFALK